MRPRNLRSLALLPALASALLVSPSADAQTMVLPAPQDSTEVRELRVAFSSFSGRSASWVQLKLTGGADDVFVIVPARAGARVDVASDAWFEALAATTNPRVLPPQGDPPACSGKTAPAPGTVQVVGSDDHAATTAAEPGSSVLNLAQLLVWAGSEGLSISGDQAASLADLEVSGHSFVVVRFQPAAGDSLTKSVRVAPSSASGLVPLLLSRAGASRVAVSAWVFSEGRAVPETLPALGVASASLTWAPGGAGSSNYEKLRDQLLSKEAGQAWVVDAASHSTLFFHTALPGGTGMVPSLAGAYFERAAGYGDAPDSYPLCVSRFATLEGSGARVAPACGHGGLASVSPADCTEYVSEYDINPEDLRCGPAADDLAIALSSALPAHAWLTRWTSWIEPWGARPGEAFHAEQGGTVVGPLFPAKSWEAECAGDAGADSGKGGSGNTGPDAGAGGGSSAGGSSGGVGGYTGGGQGGHGGSDWGGGYGNSTGNPGQGGYYGDDSYGDDDYEEGTNTHVGVYAEGSCSSSSSSASGDSCSGNSSSSDSGGDSCSSDSSDTGGDSCSGDSSGDEAESCSGDSSGSEAESCSGDSSGSGSADSCSGSSSGGGAESCSGSSGGSSDCSVARTKGGRKRPPLSGLTLGLVAVLLPLRRALRSRGQKRSQDAAES